MGTLQRFDLQAILDETDITSFVETGAGRGWSLAYAAKHDFLRLLSCELHPELYQEVVRNFADDPRVEVRCEESVDFLAWCADALAGPALFFLDAHFPGGADFGLTTYAESRRADDSHLPLKGELSVLRSYSALSDSMVVIDDSCIYLEGDFQAGPCAPESRASPQATEGVTHLLEELAETHDLTHLLLDQGYWVLRPRSVADRNLSSLIRQRPGETLGNLEAWISRRRDGTNAQ